MTDRSHTIALLLSSHDAYARGIMLGVGKALRDHPDYQLHVYRAGDKRLHQLPAQYFDGMIAPIHNCAEYDLLRGLTRHLVDVDNQTPELMIDRVATDRQEVGRLAGAYFRQRGIPHVGLFFPSWVRNTQPVIEGLASGSGSSPAVFRSAAASLAEQQQAISAWLSTLEMPIGLLTDGDALAFELINLISPLGQSVPDDIAVLGIGNNEEWCELSRPSISSIKLDLIHIGQRATERLVEMIEDGPNATPKQDYLKPADIRSRRSTDLIRSAHPDLESALRFIRDHLRSGVTADAVIRHSKASKSTLQRLFKEKLGVSILEEIFRQRLVMAKNILSMTDLTSYEVADYCGYRDAKNFNLRFKSATGITPLEWRRTRITGSGGG